jgi:bifunctional non-homologous end joining protein LigD
MTGRTLEGFGRLAGLRHTHRRVRRASRWRSCLGQRRVPCIQGRRWVHEIKFGAYRLQVRIERGRVCLRTRGSHDWTSKFGPRLIEALKQLPVTTAMLDGELVVEDEAGVSDVSALRADLSKGSTDRFVLYLFDIMHLDSIRRVPLIERKGVLQRLLESRPRQGPVRYSEHVEEDGDLLFKHACRLGERLNRGGRIL